MNSFCLLACVAVLAVVMAGADHSQHLAGGKSGEVVHWTTGSNTKGAATLNHTSSVSKAMFTTVTTKASTTAAAATTKAGEEAKATEVAKAGETVAPTAEAGKDQVPATGAATNGTVAADAPAPADAAAAETTTIAAAAPAAEEAKATKPAGQKK